MKTTEKQYKMVTDKPLAGKDQIHTKKEWKRIYGYEIGLFAGATWEVVTDEPKVFLSDNDEKSISSDNPF